METISLSTDHKQEIVDITDQVEAALTGKGDGLACVTVGHCTCGLYLNENESGLVADTLELLQELTGLRSWRHDRIDHNAAAHLGATLLGHAVLIPCRRGRLELGTWQRLMLVELDGPRRRQFQVALLGDADIATTREQAE